MPAAKRRRRSRLVLKTFRVEQYEIWTQAYRVQARNQEEAVKLVLAGSGEPIDNDLEFVETADTMGTPPSIRLVEEDPADG